MSTIGSHAKCHSLPTGFRALGDDHVYIQFGSPASLLYSMDLVDHLRPRAVRSLDELTWVPEGERDNWRLRLESGSEGFIVQQRHYVVDSEGPIGKLSHESYLPLDSLSRLKDGTDTPKAACLRDRSYQFWGGRGPDRRLHDGDLHT